MWTHAIIKGSTEDPPGLLGDSIKRDYNCYVCYSSVKENESLIKKYFLYYCGINFDELGWTQRPPLDDKNCLLAIITYFFRDKGLKFIYESYEYCCEDRFPDRKPEKEEKGYKVWADVLNTKKFSTPKSVARMLYETVMHGKISVENAKNLISYKYPDNSFSWDEIMREFRKYGGAHTKKYLRRLC